MKIIVTGGSGFVGSNTIKALKEKDYTVFNYDLAEGFDIRNFEQVCSVIEKGDKILHLAAIARFEDADDNPMEAFTVNVEGTDTVVRAAQKMGAERIIYSSTGSIYVPLEKAPPITEDFKVKGNSIYACTKHFGEITIKRAGVPYIILRYAHLYGPGKEKYGAIGKFISRMNEGISPIIYGGKQSSDFTYIKDVVKANILALESDKLNEIYNIGTGVELTVENLYQKLRDFFHYEKEFARIPIRNVDPDIFVYDISKARKMLNYQPEYTFEKGMQDWFGNKKYESK